MSESRPRNHRHLIAAIMAVAVSGALVWVLLRQIKAEDLRDAVDHANWALVLGSFFPAFLVLLFRAHRFVVLGQKVCLPTTLAATALHNFLVRVTPFRLGELSLPYFLSKDADEPVEHSLVSLLLVRVLDLVALGIGLVVAVTLHFGAQGVTQLWGVIPMTVALCLGLFAFSFWIRLGARLALKVLDMAPGSGGVVAAKIRGSLQKLLSESRRLDAKQKAKLALATVGLMLFQLMSLGMLFAAFGGSLPLIPTLVGAMVAIGAAGLPLAAVGSFGTHEAGWTVGFVWMGATQGQAIATGFASGLVSLAHASLFALFFFLWRKRNRARPL